MNCFDLGRCDEMPVLQQGIGVVALHSFCCFPEDAEPGFGPIKAGLCGLGNSAFAGRPVDDYRREHKKMERRYPFGTIVFLKYEKCS